MYFTGFDNDIIDPESVLRESLEVVEGSLVAHPASMQLLKSKVGHMSIVEPDGAKPGLLHIDNDLAWQHGLTPNVNVLRTQHVSILTVVLQPSQRSRRGDVDGEVVPYLLVYDKVNLEMCAGPFYTILNIVITLGVRV